VNHNDHVFLLRKGVEGAGKVWADFGSGTGAFTLALADLIGPGGQIYSLDKDRGSLREQERAMRSRFPDVAVEYMNADFTRQVKLPPLDGIVMANSLHFVRNKGPVLQLGRSYLRPGGRLLIVEYSTDRGNMWVPHPFTYQSWERLAAENGFTGTQLLARVPSRFFGEIYSAVSFSPV